MQRQPKPSSFSSSARDMERMDRPQDMAMTDRGKGEEKEGGTRPGMRSCSARGANDRGSAWAALSRPMISLASARLIRDNPCRINIRPASLRRDHPQCGRMTVRAEA